MRTSARAFIATVVILVAPPPRAEAKQTKAPEPSTAATAVNLRIMERAQGILSSPDAWNRADERSCQADAKTFSLYCVLERASRDVTGGFDNFAPVMREARLVVGVVASGRYPSPLIAYNNDSTTSFADVQMVLRMVRNRIAEPFDVDTTPPAAPTAADLKIAERAQSLLASSVQWNRTDSGSCQPNAKTFSVYCALEEASTELEGAFRGHGAAVLQAAAIAEYLSPKGVDRKANPRSRLIAFNNEPATTFADVQGLFRFLHNRLMRQLETAANQRAAAAAAVSTPAGACAFASSNGRYRGTCGALFNQTPLFVISPAKGITSGVWRKDAQPSEVWSGSMTDERRPDRDVEIEIYAGGTGLIRTPVAWLPVSAFTVSSNKDSIRFTIDTTHDVPPSALDAEILRRASAILVSDAVWNRQDDRQCPAGARTYSIYCAVERAEVDVTGGFHHRRPAMELVREIVDERTKGRPYEHRLMEYNNDASTHLSDVRSLFADAIARIK